MNWLYLAIDLGAISVPFIFSFHNQIAFYKKYRAVFCSILVTACFFISWDIYFTGMQVWGFNPNYVLGLYFFNLPVEEVLFFVCIPYACTFTYYSLNKLKWKNCYSYPVAYFSITLGILLCLFSLFAFDKSYTFRYELFL